MNYKQKLGYMALGAGILALGIIIGQWGTPGIEAQSNGVFDEITCRSLKVVDKHGKNAIWLESNDIANGITVYDKYGKRGVILGTYTDKLKGVEKAHNAIDIKHGKAGVSLTASESGNEVVIFDKVGKVKWTTP